MFVFTIHFSARHFQLFALYIRAHTRMPHTRVLDLRVSLFPPHTFAVTILYQGVRTRKRVLNLKHDSRTYPERRKILLSSHASAMQAQFRHLQGMFILTIFLILRLQMEAETVQYSADSQE